MNQHSRRDLPSGCFIQTPVIATARSYRYTPGMKAAAILGAVHRSGQWSPVIAPERALRTAPGLSLLSHSLTRRGSWVTRKLSQRPNAGSGHAVWYRSHRNSSEATSSQHKLVEMLPKLLVAP